MNRGTAEAAPASATADITASATSFTPTKLQFLHSLVSVPLQDPGPDAPPQSQPVTEPDDPPSGGQHRPTPAADAVIEPTSETPAGDSAPTRDIVLKDQVLDDRPVEPLPDVCATTPVDAQVADLSIASDADAAVVAVEASPENPFDTASESEEAATDRPTEDVAAVSSTVDDAADTSPDDSTVQSPSDAVAEEQPAVVVVEEEPAAVVVEEEPAVVLVEEEPDVVVGDEEPAAAVVEEEPAVVVVVEEEPDVVVGEQATLGKDEEAAGDMKSSANEPIISIRVTGPEEEEKQQQQDVPEEVVVPIPRRRSRRRTDETTTTTAAAAAVSSPTKAEAEYPDDLNPFGDEDDEAEASRATDTSSCTLNPFGSDDEDDSDVVTAQPPRVSLNPFGSDDEDEDEVQRRPKNKPQRPPPPSMTPTLSPTPTFSRTSSYKKRPAPPPPTPPPSAMASLRRKEKPAPPPPPPAPTLEAQQRLSADSDSDVVRREKSAKELSNLTVQCGVNKDSHGQWKRKKGPAPPRPMPQKRQLRKQPLKMIQQELTDIEAKQLELERQGVALERTIRAVTDSEAEALVPAGVEVEEMILQLFDLVNEKNELLRRQTELMYVRRQQRLEEEHAELEFQIRCLLEKPPAEKTDDDRVREEELIQRLVHVVHRRAEIVDCLELERRREFEEDQSIQQHLEVFNSRSPDAAATTSSPTVLPPKAPSKSKTLKLIQSPIKLMKKDKHKKASKKVHDADKDIDESESESASPAKASASGADADAAAAAKETDKDKKKSKSWFNKWFFCLFVCLFFRLPFVSLVHLPDSPVLFYCDVFVFVFFLDHPAFVSLHMMSFFRFLFATRQRSSEVVCPTTFFSPRLFHAVLVMITDLSFVSFAKFSTDGFFRQIHESVLPRNSLVVFRKLLVFKWGATSFTSRKTHPNLFLM